MSTSKPKVLCVDDEIQVLESLSLLLERRYDLTIATHAPSALELLQRSPGFAVILSDMRMPEMDGATFLAHARKVAPDAVRMLLTGYSDVDSAISAVNEGQIFRFLTKPCAPPVLLGAVESGVSQHRLITSERELLEQTLRGSIQALTDMLAITSPAAFGRATRIKTLAGELADQLALPQRWQLEVAAMFSQLAYVTLLPDTAERVYFGRPLSAEERRQVDRLPGITDQLLASIPRLEAVREILASYRKPVAADATFAVAARVLRAAIDFDALDTSLGRAGAALSAMRARVDVYTSDVINALEAVRGERARPDEVREIPAHELVVGMVLAEDVFLPTGMLLIARGHEITPRFMERIRNLPSGTMKKHVRVSTGRQGQRSAT